MCSTEYVTTTTFTLQSGSFIQSAHILTTNRLSLSLHTIKIKLELSFYYARKQLLTILSVCLSHEWISQKRCKLELSIFTVGCPEASSFRNRKAFL